jgi:glycosyltransferase involved in cell wall biosynthesis
VPEKAPDLLIRAFGRITGPARLIITGGSSHTDRYVADLQRHPAGDPRGVLTGYAYGDLLAELYSNAAAFVLPSALEGLPLTLLGAASYGIPLLASDIPPHVEVLGHDGPGQRLFPSGDEAALAVALQRILSEPAAEYLGATGTRDRILATYDWDRAAEATESAYLSEFG